MTSPWGSLRRLLLTPGVAETTMAVRGFHVKNAATRRRLETIGSVFLQGFGCAMQARHGAEAERQLELIPLELRGFAYEGAAMGFAVRDGLPVGGRHHVARFAEGRAAAHIYMVYVGVGWAMARLPRFRWSTLTAPDPVLRWLVLDGYGFHQAYFRTQRYVHEQYREASFPWPGGRHGGYASRVIDQGIGRALWFVGGADPDEVASLIEKFAVARRADLYSGAGLAATYAGGADEGELRAFRHRAGDHWPQVAQGAAFAAAARVRAGLVAPHNSVATQVLCGMTPHEASEVCDSTRPGGDVLGEPGYELWRRRVADTFGRLRSGEGG